MSKTAHRIELTANLLIIFVALLIGGALLQRFFFSTNSNEVVREEPVLGTKLILPDVDWNQQSRTLTLFLKPGCPYCKASASFYKRIVDANIGDKFKVIAIFAGDLDRGKAYLAELGLQNIDTRIAPFQNLRISGTPTLVLTNEHGEITDYWLGKLPREKEEEVMNKLFSN